MALPLVAETSSKLSLRHHSDEDRAAAMTSDGLSDNERKQALLEGHRRNPLTTRLQGGRILSAIMLPWFAVFPPKGFGVISTVGRKTGKRRRRCVRVIRHDHTVYLVSIAGESAAWLKNIRANPRVSLRMRGGKFDGVASEPRTPHDRGIARDVYCGTVNRADYGEYVLHMPGRPTPEHIRELHERWFSLGVPLMIELSRAHR